MDFLQDIKSIQSNYLSDFGHMPFNVSDWNPSNEFKLKVQHVSEMKNSFNSIDYVFSYTFIVYNNNQIMIIVWIEERF